MSRDTEPEREMPGDGNIAFREIGRAHQPAPIFRDEGARDRDAAVAQYEMMPACRPCEQAEAVIRQPMAVQVADEPAAPRVRLHPADELRHLAIGEMMGELRADDEIEFFPRIDGEHVAGAVGN